MAGNVENRSVYSTMSFTDTTTGEVVDFRIGGEAKEMAGQLRHAARLLDDASTMGDDVIFDPF
jgi:hypothetical protein